jgi:hypothetical protein
MAVSNFLMTAAAIAAVATLMSKDIRKTTTTLRQNVKQIRVWMEEAGAEASKIGEEAAKKLPEGKKPPFKDPSA